MIEGVLDLIIDQKIRYIFGNPGSTEVPLLDALVGRAIPEYLLTLHEGIAMAMADGYAMSSRDPALVSVHATPGVTNLLGGLFLASAHRSPVVVLAGQQDSRLLNRRPFLASDFVTASSPYTKHSSQVERSADVLPTLSAAIQTATAEPAGPVLVAIPRDFYDHDLAATADRNAQPPRNTTHDREVADDSSMRRAIDLILSGNRLVLLSGNEVGTRGAAAVDAVVRLAELVGARVYSEHNAINMHFPGDHPLYLGGNAHGMASVRPWLEGADTIVAIGCDLFMEDAWFDEPPIQPETDLVQLNETVEDIGRLMTPSVGMAGNLVHLVETITRQLQATMSESDLSSAAARRRSVEAERRALDLERDRLRDLRWDSEPIHMTRLYSELRTVMDAHDIMVDEAVNMASYLHGFYTFSRPHTLYSSKQSWLGWGWGAAMGVWLANQDRQVVLCIGDGSASYALQALWTAKRYEIPIKVIVLNNGRYMAVANHLRNYDTRAAKHGEYIGTDIEGMDFVAISKGFGVEARRLSDPSTVRETLTWLMKSERPAVVEALIDPDDAGYHRRPLPRMGGGQS